MNQGISTSTPTDQDAERRQALAKVYSLLLRLAEELEQPAMDPFNAPKADRKEDLTFVQLELLKQNISS